MRQFKLLLLLLGTTLAGGSVQADRVERDGLIFDGLPAANAALEPALARYARGREARFLDWLADGSLLLATRIGAREQLHRVPQPPELGEQLGYFEHAVHGAAAQPYGNENIALLLENETGGASIELLQPGQTATRELVPASVRAAAPLWAHDGRRLAFAARQRNGRDADIYVLDSAGGAAPRLIAGGSGDWRVFDWSLDDRQLLAVRDDPLEGSQLQLIDLATGAVRALDPQTGKSRSSARIVAGRFTPDGRGALYLGDQGADFLRLRRVPLDGSAIEDLSPAMSRDVEHFDISGDGRRLAYAYNDNGSSRVVLIDLRAGSERLATGLPAGYISALRFDRAGQQLAVNVESSNQPRDAYIVDFADGNASRWSESDLGPLAAQKLAAAQPLRFSTWDRVNGSYRQLPAWIYRPTSPGPHPVLILLSGGNGQPRNRYDPLLQYLVNEQGYAVILPTLRGSGGLGRSFAALGAGSLRDDAARDVGSLLVWIGLQPDLDRKRIAIQGNGVAAYTALVSLAQYGDRLQRAILVDGAPELTRTPATGQQVLVMRGFETPPNTLPAVEQLLWRLRSAGADTALLAVAGESAVAGNAARLQSMRAVAQFLAPLADLRVP